MDFSACDKSRTGSNMKDGNKSDLAVLRYLLTTIKLALKSPEFCKIKAAWEVIRALTDRSEEANGH